MHTVLLHMGGHTVSGGRHNHSHTAVERGPQALSIPGLTRAMCLASSTLVSLHMQLSHRNQIPQTLQPTPIGQVSLLSPWSTSRNDGRNLGMPPLLSVSMPSILKLFLLLPLLCLPSLGRPFVFVERDVQQDGKRLCRFGHVIPLACGAQVGCHQRASTCPPPSRFSCPHWLAAWHGRPIHMRVSRRLCRTAVPDGRGPCLQC